MKNSSVLFFVLGCFLIFFNQNIFGKESLLEDVKFLLFHFSCLLFWPLPLRYKIDIWSLDRNAHPWRALAFQVHLFSSSHYTSLCLHPSSLYLSSKILLMDKLAICCMDVIYFYLISKPSILEIMHQVKCPLNLHFG